MSTKLNKIHSNRVVNAQKNLRDKKIVSIFALALAQCCYLAHSSIG